MATKGSLTSGEASSPGPRPEPEPEAVGADRFGLAAAKDEAIVMKPMIRQEGRLKPKGDHEEGSIRAKKTNLDEPTLF